MLKIAIVDDEASQRELLTKIIIVWATKTENTPQIATFDDAESFLFSYEEDKGVDILLLDIQMKKMDGVALAKKIRMDNEMVQIIFITGFSDYMSEGYEVSALHYLMKPVSEKKLWEVLDRAVGKLQINEQSLFLTVEGEHIRLPLHEILYCESFAHSARIVGKSAEYTTKLSFSELTKQLDQTFIRCHRSYLVNVGRIKSITKTDVILDNGKAVPLSRRLYHEVNQAFIQYFKGEL